MLQGIQEWCMVKMRAGQGTVLSNSTHVDLWFLSGSLTFEVQVWGVTRRLIMVNVCAKFHGNPMIDMTKQYSFWPMTSKCDLIMVNMCALLLGNPMMHGWDAGQTRYSPINSTHVDRWHPSVICIWDTDLGLVRDTSPRHVKFLLNPMMHG